MMTGLGYIPLLNRTSALVTHPYFVVLPVVEYVYLDFHILNYIITTKVAVIFVNTHALKSLNIC